MSSVADESQQTYYERNMEVLNYRMYAEDINPTGDYYLVRHRFSCKTHGHGNLEARVRNQRNARGCWIEDCICCDDKTLLVPSGDDEVSAKGGC